ncbi:MAG: tripartite tricarboxylate transporter TctB family protein [Deltaproteobacteria bacterium]|nr:tripartite tricarboxylate transporter TctB family protein [Deltaproteobacteria bacterium]
MKNPDFKSGLFFLALSCMVCYFSWQLGLGKPSKPGPGFMPFLAGLLLGSLSFLFIIQISLKAAALWDIEVHWGNFLSVILAMFAYTYLLERIGFVFVTFLFVVVLMRIIEPQSWKKAILTGVISSSGAYLLFETFLQSQLPRSFLRIF